VILEALACGVPVVARDIPEFHDIFGDHILYFSDREEAEQLIRDEQSLKTSAAGAREFTRMFDIRNVAERHIDLYKSLVEP
jgi:glycosyltransferase involved in cell wall biosynthesis